MKTQMKTGLPLMRLVHVLCGILVAVGLALTATPPTPAYAETGDAIMTERGDDSRRAFGNKFTYTDASGITWHCREYIGNPDSSRHPYEAVVYGMDCDLSVGGFLPLPNTVERPEVMRTLDVVGVISEYEANDRYSWMFDNGFVIDSPGGRKSIEDIILPNTVRFIGIRAFEDFEGLQIVSLEDGSQLEHIEDAAFRNCISLLGISERGIGAVELPAVTSYVGNEAFYNCASLFSFTFAENTQAEEDSLDDCPSLRTLHNAPGNLDLRIQERDDSGEGVVNENGFNVYQKTNSIRDLSFSPYVTRIRGFSTQMPNLKSAVLPEGLEEIGSGLFENCTLLSSINFPSTLREIGGAVFRGCTALTGYYEPPECLRYVGPAAFYGCKNLNIVVNHPLDGDGNAFVHSGITKFTLSGDETDYRPWEYLTGCTKLERIDVTPGDGPFYSVDGVLYFNANGYDELVRYPAAKPGSEYWVPYGVERMYPLAFEGCTLSKIHLPVTVDNFLDTFFRADPKWYPYVEPGDCHVFSRMASIPTIYYVANSNTAFAIDMKWVDDPVIYKTESGPTVRIEYRMNGGTNGANPATVVGGSSVTLKKPTRSGYTFDAWYKLDDGESYKLTNGVLTPKYDELVDGVTVVEARWTKNKPAKKAQTITASDKTVAMGKTASTGAKTNGNGALSYSSSNNKIVKVNANTGALTPVKVGKAIITIKAAETSTHKAASKQVKVTVTKGANTLAVKALKKSVTISYAKVKSKAQATNNLKITKKGQGAVTYKSASAAKVAKQIKVNAKTGKITIAKGTKKGTYAVKVSVTAAGNTNYKKATKTVSFKVVVK